MRIKKSGPSSSSLFIQPSIYRMVLMLGVSLIQCDLMKYYKLFQFCFLADEIRWFHKTFFRVSVTSLMPLQLLYVLTSGLHKARQCFSQSGLATTCVRISWGAYKKADLVLHKLLELFIYYFVPTPSSWGYSDAHWSLRCTAIEMQQIYDIGLAS